MILDADDTATLKNESKPNKEWKRKIAKWKMENETTCLLNKSYYPPIL